MAVTNNPNTPNSDSSLTLITSEAFAGSFVLVTGDLSLANNISLEVDVRSLDGFATDISVEGAAEQATYIVADLAPVVKISLDADFFINPTASADSTAILVTGDGTAYRSVSITSDVTLGRLITLSGTTDGSIFLDLDQVIRFLDDASNFISIGEATTGAAVPNNFTIVLNLRTKAHSIFDEATLNAKAKTGELTFGSLKDKNVSDMFIFGRSKDALIVTTNNDEVTSREYTVTYEEAEQHNLKNKKLKLSKGLKGTNWQFTFENMDGEYAEVRGTDLFVNELKRHV